MHRHAVDYSTYPRGPRSGPGCSVPVRHHLIGPIRPTRRHIAISPQSGLYAMPSLCGSAWATREWFRAFAAHSFLACRPLRPRGVRHRYVPERRRRHWPSPNDHRLGTPDTPAIRSTRAVVFVASLVRFRYGLPGCSPPCTDRTGTPQPSGTFTSRLSTVRSPSPSLDMTTTVTGLLCWRDSHPLEWQLASLHGQIGAKSPASCFTSIQSEKQTGPNGHGKAISRAPTG